MSGLMRAARVSVVPFDAACPVCGVVVAWSSSVGDQIGSVAVTVISEHPCVVRVSGFDGKGNR